MTLITIATEDELSEEVAIRLVDEFLIDFTVEKKLRKGGNGYLRSKCDAFNKMAVRRPILLITDLDKIECAKTLIENWFDDKVPNPNLIFRVAVREIESWLLADHEAMRVLLNKGANGIERSPDTLTEPKEYLLRRAMRAPSEIKRDLVREKNGRAYQALSYNVRLCDFVKNNWCPTRASERSDSLRRAVQRLSEFN